MTNRKWMASQVVAVLLVFAATAFAQGKSTTNQGSTPNGKPFQQIQSQFAAVDEQLQAMNQQIQALQTQINNVESNLQTQINAINVTLQSHQTQIDNAAAVALSLEARVTANEASIAALNAAVADLQTQLAAAQALIAGNTDDITALQGQVNNIQTLINVHTSQITNLQQQTTQMNQFLANLVNGNCQSGQAIQDIAPGGFIYCTQAGGGNLQTVTYSAGYYLNWGSNFASVSCPASYVATGSGFYAPSYYEYHQYVSGVGYNQYDYGRTEYEYYYNGWGGNNYYYYWDSDRVAYPFAYYSYKYTSPVSVTSSYAYSPWAYAQVQFTPQNYYGGYAAVYVNCTKVQ